MCTPFKNISKLGKNEDVNCYLCKKSITEVDGYQVGTVWSCEKCLDTVKQLVDEGRIKNEE